MDIKKGYKRIKKVDILKWLREGNAIMYIFIMVVFIAAVVFMFNTVGTMFNDQDSHNVQEETNTTYVADNQSYMISINKSANFVTIYKIDSKGEFTNEYKTFRCSVNSDVKTGETTIGEKYMWRRITDGVYGHYTSRLGNSDYIHSVPFAEQNNSTLIVDAYNKLGSSASIGSIYMDTEDTKWIYENCGVDTKVRIYEDSSEKPAIELKKFTAVAADTKYDPTDDMRISDTGNVHTRIDYMSGVKDCTIKAGEYFDRWEGIYAVDVNKNDITSSITITGELDTSTPGQYVLIYHLKDDFGTDLAYWRYITVVAGETDTTKVTEAETAQSATTAPTVVPETTTGASLPNADETETQDTTTIQTVSGQTEPTSSTAAQGTH